MRTALRQSRIAGFDTLGGVSWRRDKTTLGLCDVFPRKSKFVKKWKLYHNFMKVIFLTRGLALETRLHSGYAKLSQKSSEKVKGKPFQLPLLALVQPSWFLLFRNLQYFSEKIHQLSDLLVLHIHVNDDRDDECDATKCVGNPCPC